MMFKWFDANGVTAVGTALADYFTSSSVALKADSKAASADKSLALRKMLARANDEIRPLQMNLYKKAKLANSFKWRLLESGIERKTADELTQQLLTHISGSNLVTTAIGETSATNDAVHHQPYVGTAKTLFEQGNKSIAAGAYPDAIRLYKNLIRVDPRHAAGLNNLGAALCKLGQYGEAEGYFRHAIKLQPDFPDAYSNLGNALLVTGRYAEAEDYLRRAVKLNPRFAEARINLGLTLTFLSRLGDAKAQFEKVLKAEPRNADALFGTALVAKTEGGFDKAEALLRRALKINPKMPNALAAQAGLRKMTADDGQWLNLAEELANSNISPTDESELRFAIGKYFDDVADYKKAFENYKRANDLLKPMAEVYDRQQQIRFVEGMIAAYKADTCAHPGLGGSQSNKPIFVVGMPRSGTSLTEQIISSHPSARGAGELDFWRLAAKEHETEIKGGSLSEATKKKLADSYLRLVESKAVAAQRIVDKAPVNSAYLGFIHSVFPNARIINMVRDPIDTCLSCYFQKFVLSLSYAMDLSDLVDYQTQHTRLMNHWHAVLPSETILDVPYEGLVNDQIGWTRKILSFLDLIWEDQVLDFHKTNRPVVTASFWQVRQKIYTNSVQRWRNYEKFLGPLLELRKLN